MGRIRLIAVLEILACSGLPTQFAIAGVLATVGIVPYDSQARLQTPYVFAVSLIDAAAIIGLTAWFLHAHGQRFSDVMFGGRRAGVEALGGLLLVPVVFLAAVVVMLAIRHLWPWLHNVPKNPFEGLVRSPGDAMMFAVVAVIGGGVREEVQRAFILNRFERYLGGGRVGLAISSAGFGLGHIIQGRDVAVTTAILGAFWGAVYLRRRSIVAPVVSHSGFNAAEIFRYTLYGA